MLRKETVTLGTLELLKELMQDDNLKPFTLVGGTALALQIAHRSSIDIDLFSKEGFDVATVGDYLKEKYQFQQEYSARNTLKGNINGVKVDLITHAYPNVLETLKVENVRMATVNDIAAMKLNAIVNNGTRIKDFVDIAYLSDQLTLKQMVNAYGIKYTQDNPTQALKALNFHNDIDFKEPVHLLKGNFNWQDIQKRLKAMALYPDKLFSPMPIPTENTKKGDRGENDNNQDLGR